MYITFIHTLITLLVVTTGTVSLLALILKALHIGDRPEITFSLANMSLSTMHVVDQDLIDSFRFGVGGLDLDDDLDYLRHGLTAEEARAIDADDDEFHEICTNIIKEDMMNNYTQTSYYLTPALVELLSTYTSPWEDDQEIKDSIAAYEQEMDMEWETEVTGYMYADIATMMALTTEDLYECYEDLPFTASMVRSAKPGKRGIVVMDNSDYERSAGTHNHKDHNHR